MAAARETLTEQPRNQKDELKNDAKQRHDRRKAQESRGCNDSVNVQQKKEALGDERQQRVMAQLWPE